MPIKEEPPKMAGFVGPNRKNTGILMWFHPVLCPVPVIPKHSVKGAIFVTHLTGLRTPRAGHFGTHAAAWWFHSTVKSIANNFLSDWSISSQEPPWVSVITQHLFADSM